MSNRVEELESQVAEMQATIDGLTEELVETRERLRKLEDDAEATDERARSGRNERVRPGADDPRTTADAADEAADESESESESESEEADEESEADDESSSGTDEIIVA